MSKHRWRHFCWFIPKCSLVFPVFALHISNVLIFEASNMFNKICPNIMKLQFVVSSNIFVLTLQFSCTIVLVVSDCKYEPKTTRANHQTHGYLHQNAGDPNPNTLNGSVGFDGEEYQQGYCFKLAHMAVSTLSLSLETGSPPPEADSIV